MSSAEAPNPPAKRSLFKKPAWSQPQTSTPTTDAAVDFFSRSKQKYADILKEEEERRRARLGRVRKPRARASEKDAEDDGDGARPEKRTRVEDEDGRGDGSVERKTDGAVALDGTRPANGNNKYAREGDRDQSPESLSKRYQSTVTASVKSELRAPSASPVLISDGEADGGSHKPSPIDLDLDSHNAPAKSDQPLAGEDDSDEEFPELARRARERMRQQALESISNEAAASMNGSQQPSLSVPDPRIEILITSRIPNTKPLIVQRKLHQNLRDVRMAWCQRQGFDDAVARKIFLTWRGRRLFDITTCQSLGITVDTDGELMLKGVERLPGDDHSRIHMEAMTVEIQEALRRIKESGGEYDAAAGGGAAGGPAEAEEASAQAKQNQIRVILKGKDYEDFKLIIKPTTRISKVVMAFRQSNKVDPSAEVFLMFDGDRLNPDDAVADTEIGDLDHIDVHVKRKA